MHFNNLNKRGGADMSLDMVSFADKVVAGPAGVDRSQELASESIFGLDNVKVKSAYVDKGKHIVTVAYKGKLYKSTWEQL